MNVLISGNAPYLYPVELLFGLLHCEDGNIIEIPIQYPTQGEWGKSVSNVFEEPKNINKPKSIDIVFLSIIEKRFYSIESDITSSQLDSYLKLAYKEVEQGDMLRIVIGMAPYGLIAIWIETSIKTRLVSVLTAKETDVSMNIFRPSAGDITLEDVCNHYIERHLDVKDNISHYGSPSRRLFVEYMQQFVYRYQLSFEHWNENKNEWNKNECEENLKMIPIFDNIEETLFDGTHDKLHDDGLINFHQAGKPKKLAVKWHIKKLEYIAYFWFEDDGIQAIFDRFYGAHPETKTDFMIRIDSEKNKYELALYRYGLKEPQVISESAYQLLVFKNKFEYYRSENYNQPKGAWIW